jgi:HPt (histidine-containing phosphotransfer) domain-containing protein
VPQESLLSIGYQTEKEAITNSFDAAALLARCDQDRSLAITIAEVFLADYSLIVNAIDQSIDAMDRENIFIYANSLKGSASNVSGYRLANFSERLQEISATGDKAELIKRFGLLRKEGDHLELEVRDFFSKIS